MVLLSRLKNQPFFIRLLNWEYWSFPMVYTCLYPVWLALSLRARSFFFFSAANPSIRYGGFLGESKKDIHALLPEHLYPATLHFNSGADVQHVLTALTNRGLGFPVIGKPDMGGRGRGVKVLKSEQAVAEYVEHCEVDFHIQEFVDLPEEAGIFYYRLPGEERGHISGIVRKKFLSVTGDGKHTVRQLLQHSNRAVLQLSSLEQMHGNFLDTVLSPGQTQVLVPYGNHARGALFLDESDEADEQLRAVVDNVCRQIPQFYFGRLDIRFKSWPEFREGRHFRVIEVNGAGSEPTHMYDPRHSLFFAWKEIIRHWYILWKISTMNHQRGHRYLTWKEAKQMYREDKKNSARIESMPE